MVAVETRGNVVYRWSTAQETALSQGATWTDASKKLKDVAEDVLAGARNRAPRGETGVLAASHRMSSQRFAGRNRFSFAIANTARHAAWVHDGTLDSPAVGRIITRPGGGYMGPVKIQFRKNRKWTKGGSGGHSNPMGTAWFLYYTWGGQKGQPWLDNAGLLAYAKPGNH